MFVVENLAAVGGSRGDASGIVAGFHAFRMVGNAVVRKYFMEGPAVSAAVHAVGDGIAYVHDVAQVRARRGGDGGGENRQQGGQEGERELGFHQGEQGNETDV